MLWYSNGTDKKGDQLLPGLIWLEKNFRLTLSLCFYCFERIFTHTDYVGRREFSSQSVSQSVV